MRNIMLRRYHDSLFDRNNGLAGGAIRSPLFFILKLFAFSVFFFFTLSLLFISSTKPSDFNLVTSIIPPDFSDDSYGVRSIGRSLLGLKSVPLKPRLDQIKKQADDHRSLVLNYAAYARKLKLENSKLVRVFLDLYRNYTYLITKSPYSSLFDSNWIPFDEAKVRQFEKEVKKRIKVTRQVITEANVSFDNQLKIQKLKDRIFAVNERITKVKKQGAYSSLIAAKSIPRSLHCLTMRLMEERIEHPNKYSNEGKPMPPELEDPKLYHYAIFSDNVIAASVVVNSAVKNSKEPWKHVFHVVTDKMNLGAMNLFVCVMRQNELYILRITCMS